MSVSEEMISTVPAIRERSSVTLMPVMDVQTAMSRLNVFQEFISNYLQESHDGGNDGGDYGIIPGTKKKTLLKSGADKLCEVYGLYDEYEVISSVEDWEKGLFDYTLKCILKTRRDDGIVGTGVGSCSSYESKYRWRDSQRKCPSCGKEFIIKGKAEYGGGWLCFAKKGGCNAKFKDGDRSIEGQSIGRVDNPDIIDTKNTVLKMAKKRAKIDATIGATRSSGIFSQDMDEFVTTATVEKQPEVSTEERKYSRPKEDGQGAAGVQTTSKGPEPAATVEYINTGMQANFAKSFREALPKSKQAQAEDLRHKWLDKNGFKDAEGNPTSTVIPKEFYAEIRERACEWAQGQ